RKGAWRSRDRRDGELGTDSFGAIGGSNRRVGPWQTPRSPLQGWLSELDRHEHPAARGVSGHRQSYGWIRRLECAGPLGMKLKRMYESPYAGFVVLSLSRAA